MTTLWQRLDLIRFWRIGGWLGVALTLAFSLGPPALDEGAGHADKLAHLVGYAVLMFWWTQLVVERRWKLAVAVVLFGISIELLQALPPPASPTRSTCWPTPAACCSAGLSPACSPTCLNAFSAEQGQGIGDLLDAVTSVIPDTGDAAEETGAVTVGVVGRPNVGKSSLVNRILGTERVVVSAEPGTTRDAIDTRFSYQGRDYILVDTAGIRAKGRLGRSVERYSVSRALAAVRRADVVLILVDGVEGVTEQDTKIGGEAHEAGCASILVVNKWDCRAGQPDAADEFRVALQEQFKYLAYAPVAFVSALSGLRVMSLFRLIDAAAAERARRIPTAELNAAVQEAVNPRPPPADRGRAVRIRYATQTGIKPPTFVFFTTTTGKVHFSYMRYLENAVREAFPFEGVPVTFIIRKRGFRSG